MMMDMDNNELTQALTTMDVCRRYGCDRSTLSRWIKEGSIAPARQLPGGRGAMLFNPADVEAFAPIAAERLNRRGRK